MFVSLRSRQSCRKKRTRIQRIFRINQKRFVWIRAIRVRFLPHPDGKSKKSLKSSKKSLTKQIFPQTLASHQKKVYICGAYRSGARYGVRGRDADIMNRKRLLRLFLVFRNLANSLSESRIRQRVDAFTGMIYQAVEVARLPTAISSYGVRLRRCSSP